MNFGAAACAKVHLYVHRGSFGCQLTLYVLQHLLQTCFILNNQPIPLWKGKIQQKMAKKKMWYHYHSDLFPVQRADLLASRQQTAVSRLILIGFINVWLTLFTLCMLSKIKMCYCLYAVP